MDNESYKCQDDFSVELLKDFKTLSLQSAGIRTYVKKCKGHSDSEMLFDLIVWLRQVEMTGALRLHVTHIAGTRMIQQGTDGLSRSDVTEGVMQHSPMLYHIPLHLDSMQWSPSLLPLLQSWCPESFITPLILLDWYERGHGIQGGALSTCGICHTRESQDTWYLWAPAPTAACINRNLN